jgi:aspartyl-tRNA(Asn)/glutamyl-tRNA(Gln) amidotransferase subunit C
MVAGGPAGRCPPGSQVASPNRIHHRPDSVLGRPWGRQACHPSRRDGRVLLDESADHGIEAGAAKPRPGTRPGQGVVVNAEGHAGITRNAGSWLRHGGRIGARPLSAPYHRAVISRSDVEHVASLARLGLTDEEIDRLVPQLSRILEAVGKLSSVDTSSVGPTAQVIALENVMRDDVARPSMRREAALAEAPRREGSLLRVPVVLEEGR